MLSSLTALLSSAIDYAGLFPPSQLRLNEAMGRYAAYQTSDFSEMLGCFLLPFEQLEAFRCSLPQHKLKTRVSLQWPIRIIMPRNIETLMEDKKGIEALLRSIGDRLNRSNTGDKISVKSLEFPPLSLKRLEQIIASLKDNVEAFFELSLNDNFEQSLSIIKGSGQKAKVRTGGLTPDTFPNATQLGQFILACARSQVPYKATAGLHYPIAGTHRVIAETRQFSVKMHGFLNIAVATAIAQQQKTTVDSIIKALSQTSANSFQFELDGIKLGKNLQSETTLQRLSLAELIQSHQKLFQSFGSCSFNTPIKRLQALQLC